MSELLVGTAAEHLVCSELLLKGYKTFMTDQHCPYDVITEIKRGKLIRIQVKATQGPRNIPQRINQIPAYMWHVRRAGKRGERVYADGEFDVLALVALDIGRIAYMLQENYQQTIHIRPPGTVGGKQFDDYMFDKIEEEFLYE